MKLHPGSKNTLQLRPLIVRSYKPAPCSVVEWLERSTE